MDEQIRKRWDDWFFDEKSYRLDINYTPWLERYFHLLKNLKLPRVLDLGCGRGFDTRYLKKKGLETFTTDYSWGALRAARKTAPSSCLLQFDSREHFPLSDRTFGIVVANLSIHYFSSLETSKIITELHRILIHEGWLIARVNSISDHGFQSVKDDAKMKIDEDYYFFHNIPRRYFRKETIRQFFSNGWKIGHMEETKLLRYEKSKALWEFTAQKTS